jgi:hypothetical protein
MELYDLWRSAPIRWIIVAGLIVLWVGAGAQSRAQTSHAGRTDQAGGPSTLPPEGDSYSLMLPPEKSEIADQEPLTWTLKKFPPQPYMREFYWHPPGDMVGPFDQSRRKRPAHGHSLKPKHAATGFQLR